MYVAKIFWDNPYLTELNAQITGVENQLVTVDKTIAFAFSGGQESDYGTINGYSIVKAEKQDQQITYLLDRLHDLQIGDNVLIKIDWARRYKLMRLHFAAEIILELVTQNFGSPEKIGAHIAADKARLDFAWQGNISQTFSFLEQEMQQIVSSNLPIKSAFADQEKEIRYWEIDNFAKVLCGGTHIKETSEIGSLQLKRNNIGKGKERIEILLR
ncbi:alanyl-tRNA editing protein [Sporomusa sp.]|jgi:Ser-tRNA(Ala) deacylase AlaX|uniref:alanyl-tRNA editing protein n=1 Tax=Sporomusa sp. TaxID=2078658 RepID=UPI002D14B3EF|nr:alanyl-tRNA editing protein [Sporomusa sp.]HWR06409.1 alanyl-tRNA editing protein [Sporomusa sp.]